VPDSEPEDRDERREVDVSEREVPGRSQEVELVAIPAVAAEERRRESDQDNGRSRTSDEGGRDGCAFAASR
jgi:hypothetical protein